MDNSGIRHRILVVEDEMMLAMMLEDILTDAGYEVSCAGNLGNALAQAESGAIDAAVLDVNLNGERSEAVADVLADRGIPFIFATGYSSTDLKARYPGSAVINKPYQDREVIDALGKTLSELPGRRRADEDP